MSTVVFLDTETTGLDPERHQIWEIGIIADRVEYEFHLPVNLAKADPTGLRIGRFYERRKALEKPWVGRVAEVSRWRADAAKWETATPLDMAEMVASVLDGKHMVGAVPSFDAGFLKPWLNAHGHAATWHYHLVDVEALAAGKLGLAPPWKSYDLYRAVGVDPDQFDQHTALGDARMARAVYQAVLMPDQAAP